jgi:hypothetical protein
MWSRCRGRRRTLLALARAFVPGAQNSVVPLRVHGACDAGGLARLVLVEVTKVIAADAARLRQLRLEVTCAEVGASPFHRLTTLSISQATMRTHRA